MPKLVWLGEDHLHPAGATPPDCNTWNGIVFPKGVPVEVSDPYMLRKAGPPFWRVIPDEPVKRASPASQRKVKADGDFDLR